MIDIKLIRENKEAVKDNIRKKFQEKKLHLVDEVYEMDIQYRETKTKADNLRNEKNKVSASIGELMRNKKVEEMIISNYLSKIENEKKKTVNVNKKIENKYKRVRVIAMFLGILLLASWLIK